MDFIKDYKFVISFENSSYPGYTTQKLIEPMLVNSSPIYWGNKSVGKDFNTKSFINVFYYYFNVLSCTHPPDIGASKASFVQLILSYIMELSCKMYVW